MTKILVPVAAGLFDLEFTFGSSTGTDPDIRPGIGIELIPNETAKSLATHVQMETMQEIKFGGVIGRKDAAKLRDELEIFLKNHEAGVAA